MESQINEMFNEAADNAFTTNDIQMPQDEGMWDEMAFYKMKRYCDTHLGENVGGGSSRLVYQIDDEKVLKLARDRKGVAQNKAEIAAFQAHNNYYLFPKIYDFSNNGLWIVSEYVLPSTEYPEDFEHCLGIDWDSFCDLVYTIAMKRDRPERWEHYSDSYQQQIYDLINSNRILREVYEYMINDDAPWGDISAINNWGLAKRGGQSCVVLLDSGLTKQIWNDYYKC